MLMEVLKHLLHCRQMFFKKSEWTTADGDKMTGRKKTGSERQTVEIDRTEKSGRGGKRLLRRKTSQP